MKYKVTKRLNRKGWPTSSKEYHEAHVEATNAERKKFPKKDFDKLKKMDATTPSKQLVGKNTKTGKIEVSKKVPKRLRKEVAYHEEYEAKALKRLSKKSQKR